MLCHVQRMEKGSLDRKNDSNPEGFFHSKSQQIADIQAPG
jgi:hypothetical protein